MLYKVTKTLIYSSFATLIYFKPKKGRITWYPTEIITNIDIADYLALLTNTLKPI